MRYGNERPRRTCAAVPRSELRCIGNDDRCRGRLGATASLASTATLALWNLQLTESKGGGRVRIPLSPPTSPPGEVWLERLVLRHAATYLRLVASGHESHSLRQPQNVGSITCKPGWFPSRSLTSPPPIDSGSGDSGFGFDRSRGSSDRSLELFLPPVRAVRVRVFSDGCCSQRESPPQSAEGQRSVSAAGATRLRRPPTGGRTPRRRSPCRRRGPLRAAGCTSRSLGASSSRAPAAA
jgi:hypothetical protein